MLRARRGPRRLRRRRRPSRSRPLPRGTGRRPRSGIGPTPSASFCRGARIRLASGRPNDVDRLRKRACRSWCSRSRVRPIGEGDGLGAEPIPAYPLGEVPGRKIGSGSKQQHMPWLVREERALVCRDHYASDPLLHGRLGHRCGLCGAPRPADKKHLRIPRGGRNLCRRARGQPPRCQLVVPRHVRTGGAKVACRCGSREKDEFRMCPVQKDIAAFVILVSSPYGLRALVATPWPKLIPDGQYGLRRPPVARGDSHGVRGLEGIPNLQHMRIMPTLPRAGLTWPWTERSTRRRWSLTLSVVVSPCPLPKRYALASSKRPCGIFSIHMCLGWEKAAPAPSLGIRSATPRRRAMWAT